jgi:hypothetical protein
MFFNKGRLLRSEIFHSVKAVELHNTEKEPE